MEPPQENVENVQRFIDKREKTEDFYAQNQPSASEFREYNKRLESTLRDLQDQVKRQEDDLQKLREVNSIDLSKIGQDPWARVSQVRRAKEAYNSLLKSRTELPSPGSPLPSLLAVGETSRLINETKVSVSLTAEKISADRQRLKAEEANLRDAQAIRDGLEKRLEKIRKERSQKEQRTPSQLAQEFLEEQQQKTKKLDSETEKLKDSLRDFVDEHLASMLAAENLGGPTIGDTLDISDDTLERGYTNHGKPKKPRPVETSGGDGSQRRIDEMVRQAEQGDSERRNPSNKREAAAAEMHDLLGALLDAGSSYIDITRESAASRFLVRTKVAQFHPRDARKLRLIDFGRSLSD